MKSIMIQGTMSNSGKSFVTAGLCRIFKQDGYEVAPFKSQNMALNSYITKEGLEIGRAQAMQAEAAGIAPTVAMNPILLKPTSHMGSQVIVNGEVMGNVSAKEYYQDKKRLIPEVQKAYQSLADQYDIIVLEGAGSPAEINLNQDDIVNMGMAKLADAAVLLVADIDRGGVFASVYGTIELVPPEDRKRIKGIIINKFRGDVNLLKPGLTMIEELTKIPVLGVIPMEEIDLDDEDSLSDRLTQKLTGPGMDVTVIRLPHISNFTDFRLMEWMEGISLRYVSSVKELGKPDLILLPGTKNTMGDLLWLRESGLEAAIVRLAKTTRIIGICGGYQMLGQSLLDPDCVEGGGSMAGMGLLPLQTTFQMQKIRTQITGKMEEGFPIASLKGTEVTGYEIHMGITENIGDAIPCIRLEDGRLDGYSDRDGMAWGSYLHGIFDQETLVSALMQEIWTDKGETGEWRIAKDMADYAAYKENQYNKLADLLRNSLDMDAVYEMVRMPVIESHVVESQMQDTSISEFQSLQAGTSEQETYQKNISNGIAAESADVHSCIHLYCGDGKGKTTAAIGLAIRAVGAGKRVMFYQFQKDNTSSERVVLGQIPGITLINGADSAKFSFQMSQEEKDEAKIQNSQKLAQLFDEATHYDLLILDESLYAIRAKLLSEEELIRFLQIRPSSLEVVLTGRDPSKQLQSIADYVTEMRKCKHPFDQGIKSRVGIER